MRNVVALPRRRQIAPAAVVGTVFFCLTELMLFAGLISSFTIFRAGQAVWPPPTQPRLPLEATLGNTLVLLFSGVALYIAHRRFTRESPEAARTPLRVALLLGTMFVVVQGAEWMVMIEQGLTMTSNTSNLGAFFYLIIGCHALHAIGAIAALGIVYRLLVRGRLQPSAFFAAQVFWYFVVGVWPILFWRVYL